eukprot:5877016-Pleurochrysis_carterae.AAC.1
MTSQSDRSYGRPGGTVTLSSVPDSCTENCRCSRTTAFHPRGVVCRDTMFTGRDVFTGTSADKKGRHVSFVRQTRNVHPRCTACFVSPSASSNHATTCVGVNVST